MPVTVHPTAIVEKGAQLADGVVVGPFCHIGAKARLGESVQLISHVSIAGSTTIGARTKIFPFAAMGHPPQDTSYKGEDTELIVGSDNLIREGVVFHLGTARGRGKTVVGSRGFFMNGSHVGHDNIVGDNVIYSTHAMTGGYVVIENFAILGGNSAIHQQCRVGTCGFVGGCAAVGGDVIPYGLVDHFGRLHGLNIVGLKRRGATRATIHQLRGVYEHLFHGDGYFTDRLAGLAEASEQLPEVKQIVEFIHTGGKRSLLGPRGAGGPG